MLEEILIIPVVLVVIFFNNHDAGPKEPKRALRDTILFGILAIALALGVGLVLDTWLGLTIDPAKLSSQPGQLLFLNVLIFATSEEIVKFLPIALWLKNKPFFNEVTDGIIYFAYVGFTFGTIENFLYSFAYGSTTGLVRMVSGLFFHGALTSLVGYFFARGYIYKKSYRDGFFALAGASIIHTLFNYLAFGFSDSIAAGIFILLISASLNSLMFWLFYKAQVTDYEHLRPNAQISAGQSIPNQVNPIPQNLSKTIPPSTVTGATLDQPPSIPSSADFNKDKQI